MEEPRKTGSGNLAENMVESVVAALRKRGYIIWKRTREDAAVKVNDNAPLCARLDCSCAQQCRCQNGDAVSGFWPDIHWDIRTADGSVNTYMVTRCHDYKLSVPTSAAESPCPLCGSSSIRGIWQDWDYTPRACMNEECWFHSHPMEQGA